MYCKIPPTPGRTRGEKNMIKTDKKRIKRKKKTEENKSDKMAEQEPCFINYGQLGKK
jgi:hypothetical protein